jgi:ABC-2 type transport system permease protein
MTGALGRILRISMREWRIMRSRVIYLFITLILPVATFLIFIAIFIAGVIRDLPVALVDMDQTAMSRQLTRMLDSNPALSVDHKPLTLGEARSIMDRGGAYACVVIPKNFERDVMLMRAPKIRNYYNNQYLLIGGTIYKEVYSVVRTFSVGVSANYRMKKGEPASQVRNSIQPIEVQTHVLFNPYTNYLYYLAGSLIPTMFHMFVLLMSVFALGTELKYGTAGELWRMSGESFPVAAAGKLLPYTFIFSIDALLMHALLFSYCGIPLRGSAALILLATFMMILAYQALGVFLITITANIRLALMAAAFNAATAYTFVGMTFPVMAFPLPARVWAYCVPLKHFLEIFINESIAGLPHSYSAAPFAALTVFIILPWILSFRFRKIMSMEKYWGRQ